MKRTKKALSVLLALILCLSLGVSALAAEQTYTITINHNEDGHTYSVYQIFTGDLSYAGEGVEPILSNIEWGSGVKTDGIYAALGGEYAGCTSAADVAEQLGAAADAAAFAKLLDSKGLLGTAVGEMAYNGSSAYTITGLAAGYYLVKETETDAGAVNTATDYIVQVVENVIMEPKDSGIPTIEKKVYEESLSATATDWGNGYNDVADYDIGDTVPFKIVASVPSAAELARYGAYEFIIHDQIDAGLTIVTSSIKVYHSADKASTTTLLKADPTAGYVLSTETVIATGGGSFKVSFADLKSVDTVRNGGGYIVVTFDATLNANAKTGAAGNRNDTYLEFSNNPATGGKGSTAHDKVIVFTYQLDNDKVDGDQEPLANAEFVLLNAEGSKAAQVNADTGKVEAWIDQANALTQDYNAWTALNAEHNVILKSDTNGDFNVVGLDEGAYKLLEIKAPSGYNRLDEAIDLTITASTDLVQNWNNYDTSPLTDLDITVGGHTAEGAPATGVVTNTVVNKSGTTLPETGGIGTTIFYVLGGLLVAGAVALLVTRRRAQDK